MSSNERTANERAEIAAKHLVGNLWFDLDAVPLVAGRLNPETMKSAVGGNASIAYTQMCKLLRSTEVKLTNGQLEAALKRTNFNPDWIWAAQEDLGADKLEDLYGYVAEIQNAADLLELKQNMVNALKKTNAPDATADKIKAEILASIVEVERTALGPRHISEINAEVREELQDVRDGKTDVGASTGLRGLDRVFRLVDGNYITIGARPAQGKTSLAMWIAFKRAEQLRETGESGQVLFFSLDDTERKLVRGLACTEAQVDNNRLTSREAEQKEWARVTRAQDYIDGLPFYIDDEPGLTVEEIHYRTAMQNARTPVRLLIIDYIEKVQNPHFRDNDLSRVRASADGCKNIGRIFNCPTIALSQLTKSVEGRADRWPTSSDLKYAGEEESDVAILLNRPEYYISKGEHIDCNPDDEEGIVLVNVAKNKEGKVGLVRLAFKKEFRRFYDLQHHDLNEHMGIAA